MSIADITSPMASTEHTVEIIKRIIVDNSTVQPIACVLERNDDDSCVIDKTFIEVEKAIRKSKICYVDYFGQFLEFRGYMDNGILFQHLMLNTTRGNLDHTELLIKQDSCVITGGSYELV